MKEEQFIIPKTFPQQVEVKFKREEFIAPPFLKLEIIATHDFLEIKYNSSTIFKAEISLSDFSNFNELVCVFRESSNWFKEQEDNELFDEYSKVFDKYSELFDSILTDCGIVFSIDKDKTKICMGALKSIITLQKSSVNLIKDDEEILYLDRLVESLNKAFEL